MITETAMTARLRFELGFDADNEPDPDPELELGSGGDFRPEEEVRMLEVSDIWAKAVLGGESLLLTTIVAPPVIGTVSAPSARSTKVMSRSAVGMRVCFKRKIRCQCRIEACEMSSGCVMSLRRFFSQICLASVQCRICESYTVGMSKCIVVSCRQFRQDKFWSRE